MLRYSRAMLGQQKGSAAILAVLVMLLLGTMGAAFVALSSTEINTAANFRDGVAAQYLAEAGAKRAMLALSQNSGWTPVPSPLVETLGAAPTAGRYEITVSNTGGNNRMITSTGIVNKARRQAVLKVVVGNGGASVYDSAIFANADLQMGQNAYITGDMGSNANIRLDQHSTVTGKASAHGTVAVGQGSSVPNILPNVPLATTPTLSIPWGNYSSFPAPAWPLSGGSYYVNGQYVLDGKKDSLQGYGTIYVNGQLLIQQNTNITAVNNQSITIIANGGIQLEQNVDLIGNIVLKAKQDITIGQNFAKKADNTNGSVLFLAEGRIQVDQNFGKHANAGTVAFLANGDINVGQGLDMMGVAVSGSRLSFDQNATIVYDRSIISNPQLPPAPSGGQAFAVQSWNNY